MDCLLPCALSLLGTPSWSHLLLRDLTEGRTKIDRCFSAVVSCKHSNFTYICVCDDFQQMIQPSSPYNICLCRRCWCVRLNGSHAALVPCSCDMTAKNIRQDPSTLHCNILHCIGRVTVWLAGRKEGSNDDMMWHQCLWGGKLINEWREENWRWVMIKVLCFGLVFWTEIS